MLRQKIWNNVQINDCCLSANIWDRICREWIRSFLGVYGFSGGDDDDTINEDQNVAVV